MSVHAVNHSLCACRGLPTNGLKQELVDRLLAAEEPATDAAPEEVAEEAVADEAAADEAVADEPDADAEQVLLLHLLLAPAAPELNPSDAHSLRMPIATTRTRRPGCANCV